VLSILLLLLLTALLLPLLILLLQLLLSNQITGKLTKRKPLDSRPAVLFVRQHIRKSRWIATGI
jgi:hypothetical protein